MDRLWAPWRMDYVAAPDKSSGGCVFCAARDSDDDRESLVICRGESAFAIMNLYPYNNGHLLICPHDHAEQLEALAPSVQHEMLEIATRLMAIMREKMNAQGFNFGANFGAAAGAGIEEHLHLHIVPRWSGDTNFMPVLGHTKVQVQGLKETRDLLAKAWTELDR